jgi:hypothetical protein
MKRTAPPRRYRSFLLSMWQESGRSATGSNVWRFSLECVQAGEPRRAFASLEEVMRFIELEIQKQM